MIKKILIIVVIVIMVLGTGIFIVKKTHKTTESIDGKQRIEEATNTSIMKEEKDIIIKVEDTSIWLNEEECADVKDLKDKISKYQSQGNKKSYVFEHDFAIKSTYDEVKNALNDLEKTLEITIDYND